MSDAGTPPPSGTPPPYGSPPFGTPPPPYGTPSGTPPYGPPPPYGTPPPPPPYGAPSYGWTARYWNGPITPNAVVPYLAPDERTWAIFAHASAFFGGIVVPLVIRLTKGNESRYVKDQATEALNFQLTLLLAGLVCFPLMLVLVGFVLLPLLLVGQWVFGVLAMIATSKGVAYRYPVTLRMVSSN